MAYLLLPQEWEAQIHGCLRGGNRVRECVLLGSPPLEMRVDLFKFRIFRSLRFKFLETLYLPRNRAANAF